jgi:hypothetical protein
MNRTIQEIRNSADLAAVLNAPALTQEDATETPLDWPGIAVLSSQGLAEYEIDREASTATRCVLANGTAAVDYLSAREWHACPIAKSAPEALRAHWCPAKYDTTTWEEADAVVTRDWRQVHVGQASFSERIVYDTLKEAREAYEREVEQMARTVASGAEDHEDADEDY